MEMINIMTLIVYAFIWNSWCRTFADEPPITTKMFRFSEALFANPERGWIVHRFSHDMWGLDNLRNSTEKVSLILMKVNISNYVNSSHIGLSKLDEIRIALDKCRIRGLKVIMRSAYAWDEKLASDPKNIETIKIHVMDMKSIYHQYEDILVTVEMGMFGPWGEMHSSYHSTINNKPYYPIKTVELQQIHNAYMGALPTTHSVLVRRPYYIRQIFNDDKPLSASGAYSDVAKARTGYHNDAYLHSIDDGGTFSHNWSRNEELAYVSQMSRYTYFGGESFGNPNGTYNKATNALLESKTQHMTYLHRDYYTPIYDAWGISVKQIFTRKLGYRFEIRNLSHSQEVAPGGIFRFILKLENTGFATMYRKRPVCLILDNRKLGSANIKYHANLSVDPRNWTPEAGIITVDRQLRIPAMINEGVWRLSLSLPDPSLRLQGDERYSVQFANENIWNGDDGTNLLIEEIPITSFASGSRTKENEFKEIINYSNQSISQSSAVKTSNILILTTTYDKNYSFYQVFIDADNSSSTGYLVQGIGADYLIENNKYYYHTGSQPADWFWKQFNDTITPSVDGLKYSWHLPIINLQLSITISSQVIFAGTIDNRSTYFSKLYVTSL